MQCKEYLSNQRGIVRAVVPNANDKLPQVEHAAQILVEVGKYPLAELGRLGIQVTVKLVHRHLWWSTRRKEGRKGRGDLAATRQHVAFHSLVIDPLGRAATSVCIRFTLFADGPCCGSNDNYVTVLPSNHRREHFV